MAVTTQVRILDWTTFLKSPTLQIWDQSGLLVVNAGSPKKSSPAAGLKYAAMGSGLLRKRSSGIRRARRVLSIPHGFGRFRLFYKKLQQKSVCGSVSEWLRRCTRNALGSALTCSNHVAVGCFSHTSQAVQYFGAFVYSFRIVDPTSFKNLFS